MNERRIAALLESGEAAIIEKPFSRYGFEATEIARRTQVDPNTVRLVSPNA